MTHWEIHPAAGEEYDDAFAHYLGIQPELAAAFAEHFRSHRRKICENPLLYNIRRSKTRRVNLLPRFGEYYIAYMIWHERVVILAIGHAKRKPFYWRERINESKKLF
jgi:plasmid stabilization system protein ParE